MRFRSGIGGSWRWTFRRCCFQWRNPLVMRAASLVLFLSFVLSIAGAVTEQPAAPAQYGTVPRSRDGIGKTYFGREIAQVMGHQGASWLERPEREREERTDLLLDALALEPGDAVADIGAGTGYFSWRIAQRLKGSGRVYAVDVQPEMLELLRANMARHQVADVVQPVLGSAADPALPVESLDLILLVDVYHELAFPHEMTRAMVNSLRPGGRLVLVEYRGEDPTVPIKPLHRMTVAQVRKEMSAHPLQFVKVVNTLPRQHILVFRKQPVER